MVKCRLTQSRSGEDGIQEGGSKEETKGLGVGGVSVCTCRDKDTVDVKVDTQYSGLGEESLRILPTRDLS